VLVRVAVLRASKLRGMARLCERPGCSQPAEVLYGIDAEHLLVWIESLDGAVAHRAGVLCRRHADAMVVPLGWMLDDRREAVPRLFKPRGATPPPAVRPRRQRSHSSSNDTGQLQLATTVVKAPDHLSTAAQPPESEPEPEAQPTDETVADGAAPAPWKPVFDETDDLGGLLQARSPLLSRAWGKRDRPDRS